MNYKKIIDQTIMLTFSYSSGIYGAIYNKKRVMIKNRDIATITAELVGMFDSDNVRDGLSFVVPFLINPPYIIFEFN
ncbi:hypothetical protein LCGC14_1271760 [marine sediment metagenome]|uniref:Uncharacterized protein n=1 Tax=marine sediment metagenome TaxID=412755 RepID=A0A0F9KXY7_9ZZZZ